MTPLDEELKLAYAVALNAAALASAVRFVRRNLGGDVVRISLDALLLLFLLQYLAVTIPGLLGLLSAASIGITLAALCVPLWVVRRRPPEAPAAVSGRDRLWFILGGTLVVAYLAAVADHQRFLPVTATDSLTYHLPAAVRWLQTGRLVRWPTWFFNPANTYSPLGGSVFIAWWYAPLGHDALARFAQVPAVLLLSCAIVELARRLGARLPVAVLLAVAASLSRPILNESLLAKDDVWVAAFFTAALAALGDQRPAASRPHAAPIRAGVALGLLLSIKYTALLALPALLLAIDAPLRARWRPRDWATLLIAPLLLAGPWYLRNLFDTGNPLFPLDVRVLGLHVLHGTLRTAPSQSASTWGGFWNVVSATYNGAPPILCAVLLGGWMAGLAFSGRRVVTDPLRRSVCLGPVVMILLFKFASPYAEVRFLYPAVALLFAAAAAAPFAGAAPFAALALALSVGTQFDWSLRDKIAEFTREAVIATAAVAAYAFVRARWRRAAMALVALAALGAAAFAYVNWQSFLDGYVFCVPISYGRYGGQGVLWNAVNERVPPDATIAYAGTPLTYPLMGFHGQRTVVYAPVRPGVRAPADLDLTARPLPGERIAAAATAAADAEPDRHAWLANLTATQAQYLLVLRTGENPNPPELDPARQVPENLVPVVTNSAGVLYRVR